MSRDGGPLEFGLAMFPTHDAIDPASLARMSEERGFASLHFPEHTHIPASRESPFPRGGELPRMYAHTYDPFVALTAAALATSRLRIGTGVCLVVERDPIVTAKAVASLDHLSGGRFELGVGAGWNREEMRNHGTDPRRRMAVMRERVEAMKAIWTQDEASYAGEHVSFERIWSWPKPLQAPHPPVLVGGLGPTVHDRVLAFGDVWMPPHGEDPALLERIPELRRRAAEAGREIPVWVIGEIDDPRTLEQYAAAGVARCIFWLPAAERGEVEAAADAIQRTIDRFQAAG